MPKVKLPRKSTNIDMTAMCDVAFLLLSFFILTTKFKPSEALRVVTPKSVSTVNVDQKKAVIITIDHNNKVYFSMSDDAPKRDVIEELNKIRNLGLSEAEIKSFVRPNSFVAVPFSQLKSYLQKTPDELKTITNQLPGIPVMDSTNNQLIDWMRAAYKAFSGSRMNLFIKGDNDSKYPAFKGAIDAFKKNDIFKFQMITSQENVPAGTELYKKNMQPKK